MGKVKDQHMGDDFACCNITHENMIDTLKDVVIQYERNRPRSKQAQIGPSDAGNPCNRKLAYKLLGATGINTDTDPWASVVGTSVHQYLDVMFQDSTDTNEHGEARWYPSLKIELPGYMRGTIDLYDSVTKTVIDFKVVGSSSLKSVKLAGPSQQYITQGQLYATGLKLQGHEVEHVGIMFWSRSGMMRDAMYWTMPYDEQITEETLARIDNIKAVTEMGKQALPLMTTAQGPCHWCPYYLPAITDITEGCPGHKD